MSGHGHSHGGHCCEHEAQEQPSELGIEYSLYTRIDTENVQCLNEVVEGSGKKVFKPWEKRLDMNDVRIYIFLFQKTGQNLRLAFGVET